MRAELVAEVSEPVRWAAGTGLLLIDPARHRLATLDADLRPTHRTVV